MPRIKTPDGPLTTVEYAALVGLDPETVQIHCRKGTIPGAVKVGGGVWRIPRSSVPESLRPVDQSETLAERRARGAKALAEMDAL